MSFRDVKLINFSQLRDEGQFAPLISGPEGRKKHNAGPALLFCGTTGFPSSGAVLATANLPWNPNFRRNGVLDLSVDDFHQAAVAAVSADPVLLKAAVFANDREYEVIEWFQREPSLTRLGEWCAANGVRMEQGLQIGGGGRGDESDLVGLPFVEPASYQPLQGNRIWNSSARLGGFGVSDEMDSTGRAMIRGAGEWLGLFY